MTEIKKLFAHSLPPFKGGAPEQLVILLHGYGANGRDLINLGTSWQEALPAAEFIAPNAPFDCSISGFDASYQWFTLGELDPVVLAKEIKNALPILQNFIAHELQKRNLTESELALVGFSQGTMMALGAGVGRDRQCAGILGYSGAYIHTAEEVKSMPDTLLIHGEEDSVITVDHMLDAAKQLTDIGVSTRTHVVQGLDHSIDNEGLELGAEFLHKVFEKDQ